MHTAGCECEFTARQRHNARTAEQNHPHSAAYRLRSHLHQAALTSSSRTCMHIVWRRARWPSPRTWPPAGVISPHLQRQAHGRAKHPHSAASRLRSHLH